MTNIFKEVKEQTIPKWAKFTNAGDNAQGTYVGKITGQIDGYGNEQIIYQLLQDDGGVLNVGFGLNKKFVNQIMDQVKFGQIIGFMFKGTVNVPDKRKPGKTVAVKDYSVHQDPKIVNAAWLKDNASNMPSVTKTTVTESIKSDVDKDFDSIGNKSEDVPFSSKGNLTHADQLKVIEKLAKEKLGATSENVKDKVMETLGVAFIPVQYQKIIDGLVAL